MRSVRAFAVAALVASWVWSAPSGATPFAYISNLTSGTVSVIDTATDAVVDTVTVGAGPLGVTVTAEGGRIYVANRDSNTLSVIASTGVTNTVIATVPIGSFPAGVAVNAAGTRVYVANNLSETVSVLDVENDRNVVIDTIAMGGRVFGVAVNPAGTRLYVGRSQLNDVAVVDVENDHDTFLHTVSVGTNPAGIAVRPSGTRVYVANRDSNDLSVIDTTVSPSANVGTVAVGTLPYGVAVNPVGSRVYVTNSPGIPTQGTVSEIDITMNPHQVVRTIPVGLEPAGVGVTPNGARVYLANHSSHTVSVISAATGSVGPSVPVGTNPVALGLFIGPRRPEDLIAGECPCAGPAASSMWPNHGQYVSCVARAAAGLGEALSREGRRTIVKSAARSTCGRSDKTRCCVRKDSAARCRIRSAVRCATGGGLDIGQGSCFPDPCAGP